MTWISVCSPLFETPFATLVLNGFLLLMKGLSLTNRLPFLSFYFGLGVTNDAAKPDCDVPTGDNGYLYEGCSSGKLIVIKNQLNTALMEAAIMSKMQTPAIPLWFPEQCLLGFFILEKQLTSQDMFLVRSKLSITVYLFLVLYRSTSLQSLSFLKNIETFLCK